MSEEKESSSPPLFSHKQWSHRRGYQKCVKYIGIDKNNERFGKGFPLCAVIKFRIPITRYAPRTHEIAKLLATLRFLYGEEYMEELMAMAEIEYLKIRRRLKWLTLSGDGLD